MAATQCRSSERMRRCWSKKVSTTESLLDPFLLVTGYLFALEVGDTICFLPKEHHYVLKETEEDVAPEAKKRKHGDEAEVDVKPPAAKKPHLTEQQKKQEEEDMKLALSLQPRECTLCLENIDVDFLQSLQCGCVISMIPFFHLFLL